MDEPDSIDTYCFYNTLECRNIYFSSRVDVKRRDDKKGNTDIDEDIRNA